MERIGGRRGIAATDAAALLVAAAVAAWRFGAEHRSSGPGAAPTLAMLRAGRPPFPGPVRWWNWWDQGQYARAAVAWANGIRAPDWHWYLPGYPLMGAPFVALTPRDPFVIPDLLLLLAALALCAGLARRLLDAGRWSVPLGCAAFLLTVVWPITTLRDWVIPWTTTPETVGFLGALLAVAGLGDTGRGGWRRPLLAGVGAGMVAGCRPADAAAMLVAVGGGMALLLPPRRWPGAAAAAVLGAAVPLAVVGVAYWLVWGFQPSLYLVISGKIGFEPRQLMLRWVSLVLDPSPVFEPGRGLAEGFVWVVPGLAGMAAALVAPGRAGRAVHAVVAATTVADLLLFVCYRDLHPDGIWLYNLHHYFKAVLIVLALYAARFGVGLVKAASQLAAGGTAARDRNRAGLVAGVALVVLVVPWHLELKPWQRLDWGPGNSVVLAEGMQPMEAVAMVPGRSLVPIPAVLGEGRTARGRVLELGSDLAFLDPRGMPAVLPILPLRRLPKDRTVIRFISPAVLDRSREPILYKQVVRWGMPAGWWRRLGPLSY